MFQCVLYYFLTACLTAGGVFGRPADTVEREIEREFIDGEERSRQEECE